MIIVARQLLDYLYAADLMPDLQSAYRAHPSTETAVLKVMADIFRAVDGGDLAALVLLDLSASFDTVDHDTLLHRLRGAVCTTGSGLTSAVDSSLFSAEEHHRRCMTRLVCGVPQGQSPWVDSVSSVHRRSASANSCTRSGSSPLRR